MTRDEHRGRASGCTGSGGFGPSTGLVVVISFASGVALDTSTMLLAVKLKLPRRGCATSDDDDT